MMIQMERLKSDVEGLEADVDELWREAMESDTENDGDDVNDLDYVPDELEEEFGRLRVGV
jgi:hypothetical protein